MRKPTRIRRSLRGILPLLLAMPLLWPAGIARAVTSCSFDDQTGVVSVAVTLGEVATISRLGDAIAVDGVACGTATVTNTDSIDVAVPDSGGSNTVVIDLTGGPLAPGATDEGDGSSEIEVELTGTFASFDTLRIVGSSGSEVIDTPFLHAVNLNADEAVPDADVTADSHVSLELVAGDGDDQLSVASSSDFGRATLLGGDGNDRLTGRFAGSGDFFDAGPGRDVADYAWAHGVDLVWDGSGDLHLAFGDVVENVEVAVLGGGSSTVSYVGAASGVTWLGEGNDTVEVIDPSPTGTVDDRIIRGGPGDFDLIRFVSSFGNGARVELARNSIEGRWLARYNGFEYVFGGSGDDQFFVDRRDVYPPIVGEGGDDTIDFRDAVEGMKVTLGQAPPDDGRWLEAFEVETVFGSAYTDVVLGPGTGRESLTLYGFGGNDHLRGGDGPDLMNGGGGADKLWGYGGVDTLLGAYGGDLLRGGTGGDELRGGHGDDVLLGGPGADACVGGSGSDRVDCER